MSKKTKSDEPNAAAEPLEEGRYAYDGLDRAMHEKGRLAIMTSLMTHRDGLLFGDLKRLTAMTDGNLSRHLDVLREAGLIEVWKGFEKRKPQTLCRVTKQGRKRFLEYLAHLEQVIQDARQEDGDAPATGKRPALPGEWVPG